MSRRNTITSLTSNADSSATETARAALNDGSVVGKPVSGRPCLPGSQVSLTIQSGIGAGGGVGQLQAGSMVGFALMPTTLDNSGNPTARTWSRWPGGDFDVVQGVSVQVKGPIDVPPGANAVIALPQAVTDTEGTTAFPCGIFLHVPATVG